MQDEAPIAIDATLRHAIAHDLHAKGRTGEAATFYRAALALSPERSDSWANLGLAVLAEGRADEAAACAREALRLDPENPEMHNNLGIALHALNAMAEAGNHFFGALRVSPDHPAATLNLGVVRQSLGHAAEAEVLYRRARAQGADLAMAGNNLALALAEQGFLPEAEAECRAALTARPGYAEAEVNLAMLLLMRGAMADAWDYYEARWRIEPLRSTSRHSDTARWTGAEPVEGRTILLHAEQGFGDTLQFCRYAPLLADRGARVILAVPPALTGLCETLRGGAQIVSTDEALPAFDLHCPLMSLPRAFRTTLRSIPAEVPYLTASAEAISAFDAMLPRGLRVGLVWLAERGRINRTRPRSIAAGPCH